MTGGETQVPLVDPERDPGAVLAGVRKAHALARLHLRQHDSIIALLALAEKLALDRVSPPTRRPRDRDGRELRS